jgi:hypothetical protein
MHHALQTAIIASCLIQEKNSHKAATILRVTSILMEKTIVRTGNGMILIRVKNTAWHVAILTQRNAAEMTKASISLQEAMGLLVAASAQVMK